MVIKTTKLNEVSSAQRQAFERGRTAIIQKNYTYAFQILRDLLLAQPGLFEARMALRQAQLERIGNKSSALRQAGAFFATFFALHLKGPSLLKKGETAKALDVAEGAMEKDPTLITTINFLVQAALQAKLLNVAINALEVGVRYNPKNVKALRRLADLYSKAGEDSKALSIRQQICELQPNDLSAQTELKQATAMAAMKRGKWDQADSFRDVIRDKEKAETLEQQERMTVRDEEGLQQLIKAAQQAVEEDDTPANHKRLAELYRRNDDYDKAIEQYNLVIEKSGTLDPAIDTAIIAVMCDRFDDAIEQWRQYAEKNPEKKDEAEKNIADIEKQKLDAVLERYEQRVQRYPNDPGFRFELAEKYWEAGRIDPALREFQLAQKSPKLRRKCQIYMGKCLSEKGLYDMAIEQFETALEQEGPMNKERKDAIYHLAVAAEKAGDTDEALRQFKKIYASDVNYRDVAERIETSYKKQ
mgnify:CR=1 FL=1